MAYLHCHKCYWTQDDFWDFRFRKHGYWKFPFVKIYWCYNPFSTFMSYVFTKKGYWLPQRIKFDNNIMKERDWKKNDPHSWWLAWKQFKHIFKKFKNQKWWTNEAFQKDHKLGIAMCPYCGSKDDFDID